MAITFTGDETGNYSVGTHSDELSFASITNFDIVGHFERGMDEAIGPMSEHAFRESEPSDFAAIIDSLNLMAKIDNHFASPLIDEALAECGLGDHIENSEFVSAPNTNLLGGKSTEIEVT